mmetsp:Transcript_13443/g.40569  ORF Transcript_13443/g.40569 Transcript_13443/m.40569 type:complete len:313 (-) Transcript_13443:103-1041(-)
MLLAEHHLPLLHLSHHREVHPTVPQLVSVLHPLLELLDSMLSLMRTLPHLLQALGQRQLEVGRCRVRAELCMHHYLEAQSASVTAGRRSTGCRYGDRCHRAHGIDALFGEVDSAELRILDVSLSAAPLASGAHRGGGARGRGSYAGGGAAAARGGFSRGRGGATAHRGGATTVHRGGAPSSHRGASRSGLSSGRGGSSVPPRAAPVDDTAQPHSAVVAQLASMIGSLLVSSASSASPSSSSAAVTPPAAAATAIASPASPAECILCYDRPTTHALIPCGHQHFCEECASMLDRCPVCRASCTATLRVYSDHC